MPDRNPIPNAAACIVPIIVYGESAIVAAFIPMKNRLTASEIHKPILDNALRRPLNAYNMFFQLERQWIIGHHVRRDEEDTDSHHEATYDELVALCHVQRVIRTLPKPKRRHRKTHGKITFQELSTRIAKNWKDMKPIEKQLYETFACHEKKVYEKEKRLNNQNKAILVKREDSILQYPHDKAATKTTSNNTSAPYSMNLQEDSKIYPGEEIDNQFNGIPNVEELVVEVIEVVVDIAVALGEEDVNQVALVRCPSKASILPLLKAKALVRCTPKAAILPLLRAKSLVSCTSKAAILPLLKAKIGNNEFPIAFNNSYSNHKFASAAEIIAPIIKPLLKNCDTTSMFSSMDHVYDTNLSMKDDLISTISSMDFAYDTKQFESQNSNNNEMNHDNYNIDNKDAYINNNNEVNKSNTYRKTLGERFEGNGVKYDDQIFDIMKRMEYRSTVMQNMHLKQQQQYSLLEDLFQEKQDANKNVMYLSNSNSGSSPLWNTNTTQQSVSSNTDLFVDPMMILPNLGHPFMMMNDGSSHMGNYIDCEADNTNVSATEEDDSEYVDDKMNQHRKRTLFVTSDSSLM